MGTHPKIIQKESSWHWQKSSSSAEFCSTDLPFQVNDGNTEHCPMNSYCMVIWQVCGWFVVQTIPSKPVYAGSDSTHMMTTWVAQMLSASATLCSLICGRRAFHVLGKVGAKFWEHVTYCWQLPWSFPHTIYSCMEHHDSLVNRITLLWQHQFSWVCNIRHAFSMF